MKLKRVRLVVCLVLSIFVLAGCKNKDSKNSNANTTQNVSDLKFAESKVTTSDFANQNEIDNLFNEINGIPDALYDLSVEGVERLPDSTNKSQKYQDDMLNISKKSLDSIQKSDAKTIAKLPNDDDRYTSLQSLRQASFDFLDYVIQLYEKSTTDVEIKDEEISKIEQLGAKLDESYNNLSRIWLSHNTPIKNDVKQTATHSSVKENDSTTSSSQNTSSSTSKEKDDTDDITKLTSEPSTKQIAILDELTRAQFKDEFPYKGSKMHSVLGVLQNWTESDGKWFYKVEATIVNAFGAKEEVNLEVYITPETANSGVVEFTVY